MSASKKKKLRSEGASKLTERQIAEQKEAKKVQLYSIAFVVVLVALVAVALVVGITRSISASGINERRTVAATVGSHEISNAELSYYFMDSINSFANSYGSYLYLYGIDSSTPLDQQVIDEDTGETWADSFISQAISSAQSCYALADAAAADGFTLPEEEETQLDTLSLNLDSYASLYGYKSTDAFLKAQYGSGASKESYLAYYERSLLASAYQTYQEDSLTYTDEQIREADAEDPARYSSYSYNQYYLSVSRFYTGGTTDDNGTTTYSDEEKAAAAEAAAQAVAALTDSSITSAEDLDAAIAALSVNEGTEASSTTYTDQAYSAINSYVSEWITDASRLPGDLTSIPVKNTATDEDGNETESIVAYYVVLFNGVNTNEVPLVNVRHILVSFEGETNEDGTYTEEAKEAAKTTAEEILASWEDGDATEDSFAALANEKSTDTGSNTNGGLYEDVYPGQMVANFNDWCFADGRKAGDTGIVETSYGYHIMYFVGNTDQNYRDFQITNTLKDTDMETWYETLIEGCPVTEGDTSYMHKDVVLSSSY